jgi:hypothetical protein
LFRRKNLNILQNIEILQKNFPSCAHTRERAHTHETLQTEESIKQLFSDFQVSCMMRINFLKSRLKKWLKIDSMVILGADSQSKFRNQAYAPLVSPQPLQPSRPLSKFCGI